MKRQIISRRGVLLASGALVASGALLRIARAQAPRPAAA